MNNIYVIQYLYTFGGAREQFFELCAENMHALKNMHARKKIHAHKNIHARKNMHARKNIYFRIYRKYFTLSEF